MTTNVNPTPTSTATPNEGGLTQQALAPDAINIAADTNANTDDKGNQPNPGDVKAKPGADDASKTDDKTTDDKAKADDKKADDKSKAPEAYVDFTLPEGNEVDVELMGEFKTVAKELGLTQEQAQKLAELGGKIALKATGPGEDAIVAQAKTEWGNLTKADKEIGGDKLVENLSVAKKTLDTFGTPALKELLNKSGMGNHPEVIRLFLKIGKQISEDNVLVNGNRSAAAPNHADKLYGSTSNKTT